MPSPEERDTERAVEQLERELFKAFFTQDTAALDRILADEFTFTDPGGIVLSKAQWLDDVAAGDLRFEAFTIDELAVKALGDTAIVHGKATLQARYSRSDYNGQFSYVDVYTRRNGLWQVVLMTAQREKLFPGD